MTSRLARLLLPWRRPGPSVDDVVRTADIRWRWRQACEGSGLTKLTYTASGPTISVPLIGRIEPGPPARLTARLLPGQQPADVAAAAPRIASAMGASEVTVREMPAGWVSVELRTAGPALAVVPQQRDVA